MRVDCGVMPVIRSAGVRVATRLEPCGQRARLEIVRTWMRTRQNGGKSRKRWAAQPSRKLKYLVLPRRRQMACAQAGGVAFVHHEEAFASAIPGKSSAARSSR